jgi:hypothetical protein
MTMSTMTLTSPRSWMFSGSTWRWLIMAGFALGGITWTICLGLPADVMANRSTFIFATGVMAISILFGRLGFSIIADVFDTVAQVMLFIVLGNWLSCLTISTFGGFPLEDALFAKIDEAMGLEWLAWWNFLQVHQTFHKLIRWVYLQEAPEYGLVLLYLCILQKIRERERLIFATKLSSLLTLSLSAPLPAIGAGFYYGVGTPIWTDTMNALRAHTGDVLSSFGSNSRCGLSFG